MNIRHFANRVFKYLRDEDYRFCIKAGHGKYNYLSDEEYLSRMFKARVGYTLNLENPSTFNEKLQWLKLYDRQPIYTKMVDKYEVKKIVAEKIGDQYVIPTIGVWDHFDDIDFEKLPKQFVLKCTHDSGGLVICKDKDKFNKASAKKKIENCLKRNFYYVQREWPYRDVKPRIIAEPYLEDSITHDLRDYKFFTFNGEVKALFIATERQTEGEETKFDFFDADGNLLPFTNGHPHAEITPTLPVHFDEMKKLASKLGKGIPQVRVDFYEANGNVYFGELTFFHWSGFVPFEPVEWDYKFGQLISLPSQNK